MKSIFLVFFAIFVCANVNTAEAQTFSKSSIKVAIGPSASACNRTLASRLAASFSVGYQRELWNSRFRLNPNLTFGAYTHDTHDTTDAYFNSINLQVIFYADVIKLGNFSFVMGAGPALNNSRGLGVDSGFPHTTPYEHFNEYHFGGYVTAGIRVNNPDRRIAYELYPLYIQHGMNVQVEFGAKAGLDFKF